jgi:threonylcarbamoyladenosine tRNA methylthiotransferase MtaB
MPEACIGVDVIVGFPGETEALFAETYQYLQELDISYLHVFTYSEREGTEAPLMPGKVDMAIRKKRSKMLRILSAKKRRMFYEKHLGTIREVLFEKEIKDGYLVGFTDNYIKVRIPWNPVLSNQLCSVQLDRIDEDGYVRISLVSN